MSDCSCEWYEHIRHHVYCELSSGKGGENFAIFLGQKTTTFSKNVESKIDKKEASNTTRFFTTNKERQHNSYSK